MEVQTEQKIDRTAWATEPREALGGGVVAVTLDGHDAGLLYPEGDGRIFPMLEGVDPLDDRMPPLFVTAEAVVAWVKENWAGWWKTCEECLGPVTEADLRLAGVREAVAVTCAECRARAAECGRGRRGGLT